MKSKLFVFLLGIGAIGGALLAWRQHAELVELRAAVMNREERSDWERRVRALEKLNREQQEQFAASHAGDSKNAIEAGDRRGPTGEVKAGLARSDSPVERTKAVQEQAAAIRELMTTTEVQAIMSLQKKAAIEQRYADLFKKLNLPPDQIQKLAALLEERANTMQDIVSVARDQGINLRENPEAYRKLVAEAQNQINNSIKAAIGENGLAQLTNYDRTLPQRNLVSDLEHRLGYTGNPLTPAQAEQLVQTLAAHPAPRAPATAGAASGAGRADAGAILRNAMTTVAGVGQLLGATDDTGRTAIPGYPISQAAVNQAQAFLSPPQLAALQNLQNQQQAQQRLKNLVTETLLKSQPPASPPPPGGKRG